MHIFCDSSVNKDKYIGIGSYLILDNLIYDKDHFNINNIIFNTKSSTMAEYFTVHHCLNTLLKYENQNLPPINLYTDCKNFYNLISKRQYNSVINKHKNFELYKCIIDIVNKFKVNVIWTKGHMKNKIEIYQQIFSFVDKNARRKLREYVYNDNNKQKLIL